jgi:hypothetical protein
MAPPNAYCWRLLVVLEMTTRPFVLVMTIGLTVDVTPFAFAVAAAVTEVPVVAAVVVAAAGFVVVNVRPAVRCELTAANVDDDEMLAGGFTTAAAVGESVPTAAKPLGTGIAALVGVTAPVFVGMIVAAAFVTFAVPVVAFVVASESDARTLLPATSPTPLVIAAPVGFGL